MTRPMARYDRPTFGILGFRLCALKAARYKFLIGTRTAFGRAAYFVRREEWAP